ncbi:MAG TPA: hypothetical protein QF644_03945, partial [Candidatus Poseidoniaceae archaeon]|nr:hypothetical protein [Candidatus Poseidoniaceae archaeon]
HMASRGISMLVFSLLFLPLLLPLVGASSEWKEDGWLDADWYTKEGRIAAGDELGCQEILTLNLELMPKTTALECKKYLNDRTNASRWGSNPLSFGIDLIKNPNFDSDDHEALFSEGFAVHGLNTNYENTVWHNANDFPENSSDWWNLGYSGSLEQTITPLKEIQDLANQGAMVNLYWQAQIADLKVRTNGELVEWLESENAWYTAWGESYSYEFHRNNDVFNIYSNSSKEWNIVNQGSELNSLAWDLPVTRGVDIRNNSVVEIKINDVSLQELSVTNKTLEQGWRQEQDILWITLASGQNATIVMKNESEIDLNPEACDDLANEENCVLQRKPRFFNNHPWALTIAGHHTTDLFKWSMKFDESPLVFTWLVEPQEVKDFNWFLIVIAASAGIGAVAYTRHLVKRDKEEQNLFESE